MTDDVYKGRVVTKSVPKKDALSLAMGKPMFTDDKEFKNLLYVKMLYSPHAHAIIENIDTTEAEKLEGVVDILTYKNCSQVLHTTAGQGFPEPSCYDTRLFNKKVKFVGDRVAAVAAESLEIAEKALPLIKVQYSILEPILDHDKALGNEIVIHDEKEAKYIIPVFYEPEKNHVSHLDAEVGNLEQGLAEADVIVERTVRNHYGQHCPLEPHISIAYIDDYGRLVVRTATQVPFHARRILAQILEIPLMQLDIYQKKLCRIIKVS